MQLFKYNATVNFSGVLIRQQFCSIQQFTEQQKPSRSSENACVKLIINSPEVLDVTIYDDFIVLTELEHENIKRMERKMNYLHEQSH